MKKVKAAAPEPQMRASYKRSDFSRLERGKFHKEAVAGTSVVLLDPALAKVFPNSQSVNDALRGLMEMSNLAARLTTHKGSRAGRRVASAG